MLARVAGFVVALESEAALAAEASAGLAAIGCDNVSVVTGALPAGHAFTVPEVLFAKISDESRDEWQDRFKGIRA